MKPVYLEDLQAMMLQGCGTPGCTHDHSTLYLKSRCHPEAGVQAIARKGSDVIDVKCNACEKPIVSFKVASKTIAGAA